MDRVQGGIKTVGAHRFTNLLEIEAMAKPLLPAMVYDYYAAGADDEHALAENRQAFARLKLLPRVMVNVSSIDPSCSLFGMKMAIPLIVAPMAMQAMCHQDGERAVARGALANAIPMGVSTMATTSIQDVAATGATLLFQVYVVKHREVTRRLIQDAERLGYQGILLTCDAPFLGKREADERNNFHLPAPLQLSNLVEHYAQVQKVHDQDRGSGLGTVFVSDIDASLTWDFLAWLHTITSLPIILKGVLSPEDARLAVEHGADGICVSNHGGRQLDSAPAAVDMLPRVVQAVQGRIPVLVDGGIRRGSDVFKCLALGASAVLLGRPVLWGLTLGGQQGVEAVLELIRTELLLCMALMGAPTLSSISRAHVITQADALSRPMARL